MSDDRWNAFITRVEPAEAKPGPLSGRTLAVKDLFDTAGVRTTYGSKVYARPRPRANRSGRAAARRRRRRRRRQDPPARVRLERDRPERVVRHLPQPRTARQDDGRLVERQRRGARRRPVRPRAGLRHGRLDPHPVRLLRHGGAEVGVGADPAGGRVPARADARHGRADGAHGVGTPRSCGRCSRSDRCRSRAWRA